jgi:tryptophan halogenase
LINKVLVLGGTSAGLLTALALKARIPELQVQLVRLKDSPPQGSESSSPHVTSLLHAYLQLELTRFIRNVKCNWTLGNMLMWGPRDHFFLPYTTQLDQRMPNLPKNNAFYVGEDLDAAGAVFALMAYDRPFFRLQSGQPAWHWDVAYQMDTGLLVHALAQVANAIGVETVEEDTLTGVKQDAGGVAGLVLGSGRTEIADLYIDCSGDRSLLLGGALKEPFVSFKSSLPCDRMLIAEGVRGEEPIHPHTFAHTMPSGWTWQLELLHRVDRGYVYNSAFATDQRAEQEFRVKYPGILNPRVRPINNGRYERAWAKNVVGIGDSSGYVEPLASTSLGLASVNIRLLVETLSEIGRQVSPAPVKLYNRHHTRVWDGIRRFLAIHYKYNTKLQSPFWQACRKDVDLSGADTLVEYYRQCGPSSLWGPMLVDSVDLFPPVSYLALLMGLNVETRYERNISRKEREIWEAERLRFRSAAMNGVTVAEALNMLPPPAASGQRAPVAGATG